MPPKHPASTAVPAAPAPALPPQKRRPRTFWVRGRLANVLTWRIYAIASSEDITSAGLSFKSPVRSCANPVSRSPLGHMIRRYSATL